MGKLCGRAAKRWALAFAVAMAGFGGNASAILLDRGPDMVYDTVLDITWTRQAGDGALRSWADANAWAAALVFGGFDDWRLPFASVSGGAGTIFPQPVPTPAYACNGSGGADEVACRDNEMGYMFYYNLDGNLFDDKTGDQTAVGGEVLTGIQLLDLGLVAKVAPYWSGTMFFWSLPWAFNFANGVTFNAFVDVVEISAWAVRPGDVAAVPEPGSLLLLALGALGLGWSRRRRQ